MAVRRCLGSQTHCNVTGPRGDVLNNKLFPPALTQFLSDEAPKDIAGAACGGWYDDAHGPCRIGLRPCDPWQNRQRGSAGGQMQKTSAGELHRALSWIIRRS